MWSHSPSSSRNPLIHPSFLQINQKLGRSSQRIINLLKNIHNSLTYTMTVLLPILMYLWIHRYRYWIRESSIFSLFFFFLLQRSLRSSFRQSPLSFLLSPLLLFVTRHIYIYLTEISSTRRSVNNNGLEKSGGEKLHPRCLEYLLATDKLEKVGLGL